MTDGREFPAGARLRFDRSVRRLEAGAVLLGGSPLRFLKLTEGGAAQITSWMAGERVGSSAGQRGLARRLLDTGLAHPVIEAAQDLRPMLAVVLPVKDDAEGLRTALNALAGAAPLIAEIVVVDDGSLDPRHVQAVADAFGTRLVRHEQPQGPGAARNAGLAAIESEASAVLFVDADVELDAEALATLVGHLNDPQVVAVAPRIRSALTDRASTLARYERAHSPLDLGDEPARVQPKTRVSYVPTAALLVRAEPLRELGGFDPALRYGEDVDLVWKLVDRGGVVRFDPASTATHRPRRSIAAWLKQRQSYGSAAAPLARRHHGRLAPVVVSGWSAAAWAAAAIGHPLIGAGVAAGSGAMLPRKLTVLDDPWPESVRLVVRGNLAAGRQLADALHRPWWPLSLLLALVSRRVRVLWLGSSLVLPLLDWLKSRPDVGPVSYVALRWLDDASYSWGVWLGCIRERSVDALRPDFTDWPGRSSPEA